MSAIYIHPKVDSPADILREELVAASGQGLEQFDDILPVLEKLLTDPVTGLWNNRYRVEVLKRARAWVAKTGITAHYVEFDVRNLGGANAELGHEKANELVLKPIARCIQEHVAFVAKEPASWHVMFRHGGDELSLIIGGVEERALTTALDTAVRAIQTQAESSRLDTLPHPKHILSFRHWGIGVAYGFARIEPPKEFTTLPTEEELFSHADRRLERYKRGLPPEAPDPLKITTRKRLALIRRLLRYLLGRCVG